MEVILPPKRGEGKERWGELQTEDREEKDARVRTSESQEGMATQTRTLSMGVNLTHRSTQAGVHGALRYVSEAS